MANEFKYILELEGKDYGKHIGRNDEHVYYVPFRETNYFMSIVEAMDALVLKDIRSFEEVAETVRGNRYHEIASLRSVENDELLMQVGRISFHDAPDASPTAGIYLFFEDRPIQDFEERTGFDFKGFSDYDPDSPFLLIGSYSYEFQTGFNIVIDQAVTDWENSLNYYELDRHFNEDDWTYKVEIVKEPIDGELIHQINNYHFQDLPTATRHLLKAEPHHLDKDLAEGLEEKCWVTEANLKQRGEGPLVSLIAVKSSNTNEKVSEPGIHMKFFTPIEAFEECANINLKGLGNYGDDDMYLLLANYYIDPTCANNDSLHYSDLLPHPGYTALLNRIKDELRQEIDQQQVSPFLLRVVWDAPAVSKRDISIDESLIQDTPFNTVDDGLDALLKLETSLFDSQSVSDMGYPLFIKRAEIIDTEKNTVIIAKYQRTGESDNGMYISFDNNQESISLMVALDLALKKRRGQTDIKLSDENGDIQRKRSQTDRIINTPGSRGKKL
ncbi:hypothetical protein [Niabella sp.]|uniref:hypothetical protein n=1 Tax=Niabella sp. TaxID=1962976 RepID=UPI00262DC1FB|nr:hypothetical protein [Niabella sp.]